MSTKLIQASQLTMWNEIVPPVAAALGKSLLASEYANKKGQAIGQGLRLIPVSAGTDEDGNQKDCLAVRFPKATKDELVAKQNGQSIEMKRWLIQQIGAAILNDDTIGGAGMRVSKNKRLSMTFKSLVPQVAMKSDIEYAAELGCTVEQVAAIRKEAKPIIEVASSTEPAAPTVKKGKKKATPVAAATPTA